MTKEFSPQILSIIPLSEDIQEKIREFQLRDDGIVISFLSVDYKIISIAFLENGDAEQVFKGYYANPRLAPTK